MLDFIRPIDDAAEFLDVGIAQFHQGFRRDLAAPTAAAVDENQLFLVGQHFVCLFPDLRIGDQNRFRDVTCVIFILLPHIEDDIAFLAVHDLLGFLRCDVHIYRPLIFFFILPTGSKEHHCQKQKN